MYLACPSEIFKLLSTCSRSVIWPGAMVTRRSSVSAVSVLSFRLIVSTFGIYPYRFTRRIRIYTMYSCVCLLEIFWMFSVLTLSFDALGLFQIRMGWWISAKPAVKLIQYYGLVNVYEMCELVWLVFFFRFVNWNWFINLSLFFFF